MLGSGVPAVNQKILRETTCSGGYMRSQTCCGLWMGEPNMQEFRGRETYLFEPLARKALLSWVYSNGGWHARQGGGHGGTSGKERRMMNKER